LRGRNLKYIVFILFIVCLINPCYAQDDRSLIYICYDRGRTFEDPNDALIILDTVTLEEIDRISLDSADPFVIEMRSDNKVAFIGHDPRFTTGLSIVDLVQKRRIKTMFTGNRVFGIRINSNGLLYVLLDNRQIALVNTQTFQLERTIDLPDIPIAIIFSPDGKRAYISLNGTTRILVMDLNNQSIIKIIDVRAGTTDVNRLAISPDGRSLYVACDGLIQVINTSSLEIVDSLPGTKFTYSLLVSSDGKTLYAADFGGGSAVPPFLIVIDIASRSIIQRIDVAPLTRSLAFGNDDQILYANNRNDLLYIIDTKTNTVLAQRQYDPGVNGFGGGIVVVGSSSVGSPPTVQLLSPQANEIVQRGNPFTIKWQTVKGSLGLSKHQVDVSLDGGQNFTVLPLANNLSATTQEFIWNVPNQSISSAQIRVTATDLGGRSSVGLSGIFSIGDKPTSDTEAPTVRFISPIGGEKFNSGDTININWNSTDNIGVASQDLTLSTDGGSSFSTTLATGLNGVVQSFSFKIPDNLQTQQARLRLIVRDAAGNSAQAITASDFQIQALADTQSPVVEISTPKTNEILSAGQAITVNWNSTDNVGVASQALLLSLNGGTTFQTISSFDGNTATFTLNNVSNLDKTTSNVQIKITATDAAGNNGEQTTSFKLAPVVTQASFTKPTLTINGVGFTSNNSQASVVVLINGKAAASLSVTIQSNTLITVKGNKKKLGLIKGSNNSLKLIIDGVESNIAGFAF
jgi:hypothetical protein